METNQITQRRSKRRGLMFVIYGVLVIAVIGAAYVQFFGQKNIDATSFASCQSAGGRVTEGDPAECVIDGKTFTSEDVPAEPINDDSATQKPVTDEEIKSVYIGLREDVAIARANSKDRQARVVKRDGESVNQTTDLQNGRLNLTVEDGVVTAVEVEHINFSDEKE